jgi:hypothetical protein
MPMMRRWRDSCTWRSAARAGPQPDEETAKYLVVSLARLLPLAFSQAGWAETRETETRLTGNYEIGS